MACPLTLLLLTILSLTFTSAQTWEGAYYFRLARLPCVKATWFDTIINSPTAAGMRLSGSRDISQCRLDCWHSDYRWAFWQSTTETCFCSYEENLPADQVADTVPGVFYCQGLGVVTLNHLIAQYDDSDFCATTKPGVIGPAVHYPTVLQCINHCGKAPSEADFYRTSYVTPQFDTAAGEWNYLCECSHTEPPNEFTPCGADVAHVYKWNWDYQE
ncbi:hypothetical protein I317_00893 [Kwoniella heveanensis CBS 569]|nr:hypothetical protein I317_00893 [Kwoniella heveanensis CBS 569]